MEIMNHNASFREFVYRVELTLDEIWEALTLPNCTIPVRYRVDREKQTITFSAELPMGQPDITYGLTLTQRADFAVLKVTQLDWLREKNAFARMQNEFWKKMLGAQPVDYIRYS